MIVIISYYETRQIKVFVQFYCRRFLKFPFYGEIKKFKCLLDYISNLNIMLGCTMFRWFRNICKSTVNLINKKTYKTILFKQFLRFKNHDRPPPPWQTGHGMSVQTYLTTYSNHNLTSRRI